MIKYYMRPDSNIPPAYSYVVGEDTDVLWNAETCIEVDEQPDVNYNYDMAAKAWKLNEASYMSNLRSERNEELASTDKYMLEDYPISAEEKEIIKAYRKKLRDAPNKPVLKERVMPLKVK